jgi:hypothetical protein
VWFIGTTRYIRFTGTNVSNAVMHYQSTPGGAWHNVLSSLNGEIAVTDPHWGAYPWTLPDDASTTCRIAIAEYMNQADVALSETFEIRAIDDGDGDGMDDGWEAATFGDTTVADAGSDYDDDGVSDVDEFFSGTDPKVDEGSGAEPSVFSCAAGGGRAPGAWGAALAAIALCLARARRRAAAGVSGSP